MSTLRIEGMGMWGSGARYRVAAAGRCGHRAWDEGDVLLVEGEVLEGQWAVLEPTGFLGRPVVGQRQGAGWIGPHGERCHAARWRCMGRIRAVVGGDASGGMGDFGQLALFGLAA